MGIEQKSARRYDTIWWCEYTNRYYKFDRYGNKHYLQQDLEGGANPITVVKEVFKRGKAFIMGRDGPGPALRQVLATDGDIRILNMYVCRDPIFSNLDHLAGLVSNGEYDKAKEELSYDKMFHLCLKVHLENGKYYKLEKNEEVEAKQAGTFNPKDLEGESKDVKCKKVPLENKTVTMNDLINKGEESVGKHTFWSYDPVTNNCQHFIKIILSANGLLNSDLEKFILQNVAQVFKSLPGWTQKLVKVAPNFKQRLNILFRGVGKHHSTEECHEIMGGNLMKLQSM